jgi:hypothetical protein
MSGPVAPPGRCPEQEGVGRFCSASLMIDRATGRAVPCASFDSREAMERNREQSNALKASSMREASAEELEECEFELVVADLRAPELV